MQYHNNILCLTYDEVISILPKGTYDSLKSRGNINVHGIGGNGRIVLIEYETMPVKYKKLVKENYGDPYAYVAKQPILNSIEWDYEASTYYSRYILQNGSRLPNSNTDIEGKPQINYVHRYTEAASWLNMLIRLTNDKPALKRELNITIMDFWDTASEMISLKKVSLPATPKRLKEKIKIYQANGYESLIELHKFGNSFSKKIADETAEAFLQELLANPNKHDDTIIVRFYNQWALETGRKTITAEAVGYWRRKWANILLLEREGVAKTYNKLSKQGKRNRPSAPLLLINSDDNILDAYFRNNGNDYFRPALYVVIDAFNDYILGYAIGNTVTKELIKEAYRNAQRHVMELTGDAYVWQQIQTDHWGISGKNTTELEEFYNSMALFFPAGLKNSQTKYVERSFGTTWHQMAKLKFGRNYSGHNITSKERINPDTLQIKNFPDVSEMPRMIADFIEAMRHTVNPKTNLDRQSEWVKAFRESDKSKKRCLSIEERLQVYGKQHSHSNRITASGVEPVLLGEKRIYELSQAQIFEHNGKTVQVTYDEHDLSKVLITDGKGLRFVASEYKLLPSAIADYEPGDGKRVNALKDEKKQLMPMIKGIVDKRKSALERGRIDAESRLMAGVLVKEINHADQQLLSAPANVQNDHFDDDDDELNIYKLM